MGNLKLFLCLEMEISELSCSLACLHLPATDYFGFSPYDTSSLCTGSFKTYSALVISWFLLYAVSYLLGPIFAVYFYLMLSGCSFIFLLCGFFFFCYWGWREFLVVCFFVCFCLESHLFVCLNSVCLMRRLLWSKVLNDPFLLCCVTLTWGALLLVVH